jgi:hypothetical protein
MPGGTRNAAREFSSDLDALDCTSVTFRDAAGVWWTRMPRGELRDESFPTALSGASLAAAFEWVTGRRIRREGSTRRLPPAEAQSVASPSPAHRPKRLVAGELEGGRSIDGHALSGATTAPGRPPDDSVGRYHRAASAASENSAARMHWPFGAVGPRTQSHVSDLRLFVPSAVHDDESARHTAIRVQVPLSDTDPLRML